MKIPILSDHVKKTFIIGGSVLAILFVAGVIISSLVSNTALVKTLKLDEIKSQSQIKALQLSVKARDLAIAADSLTISRQQATLDSIAEQNKVLLDAIKQTQKINYEKITSYRRLSDNDRLREFSELIR